MAAKAVLAQIGNGTARVQNVDVAGTAAPTITEGWITSAAQTASFTSDTIVGVGAYTNAFIHLIVSAHSGTSPTLNVYLQQQSADATTWNDIGSFTQVTTSNGSWFMQVTNGGSATQAKTDGSLAAGSMVQSPFAEAWRLKCTIAGTNPSYTMAVYAEFKR